MSKKIERYREKFPLWADRLIAELKRQGALGRVGKPPHGFDPQKIWPVLGTLLAFSTTLWNALRQYVALERGISVVAVKPDQLRRDGPLNQRRTWGGFVDGGTGWANIGSPQHGARTKAERLKLLQEKQGGGTPELQKIQQATDGAAGTLEEVDTKLKLIPRADENDEQPKAAEG